MNTEHTNEVTESILPEPRSRRRFLAILVGGINAIVFGALVAPVAGFIGAPLRRPPAKGVWVDVLDEGEVGEGETKGVEFRLKVKDGFDTSERVYSAYVHKSNGELVAFDPACTHLGCRVEFQERKNRYFCPCHGGVFTADGKVQSGPPPSPLNQHPIKIENGKIWVSTEVIESREA